MLLICPVRPGDTNEELRYALRSWETNLHLGSELALLTVGYKPTWLTPDDHLEGNYHKSAPIAVYDNICIATDYAAVDTDEVVYMNDDFFCLDPVGSILPVRRDISLAEHIAMFPRDAGLWWPRSLQMTESLLTDLGFLDPHSYEVHRPLVASPRDMLRALSHWSDLTGGVPQWRTMYGVINRIEAYPVSDVKLGTRITGYGTPWVSTSDSSWRRYSRDIRARFQKPSRWER